MTSKEVEALIDSLTEHEDKYNRTKSIRTIDDIQIGDSVRLKMGIRFAYDAGIEIQNNRSVGKVSKVSLQNYIRVHFPEFYIFLCTLGEIEFAT